MLLTDELFEKLLEMEGDFHKEFKRVQKKLKNCQQSSPGADNSRT
jgi:hypothetical protein